MVGRKATFRAVATGTLHLPINDRDNNCLTDNKGALEVSVRVTHRP